MNEKMRHDPKSNGKGLDSMKKRVLSLLLCLAFLLVLLPAATRADGDCGDNLAWSFDDTTGKLTITGTGDMWDWSYSNTPWEAYMNQITSVELPEGLTTIGGRAFCGTKITGIEIPGTVTAIAGSYAFSGCTGLKQITFPGSLTSIGQDAFSGCTGLTSFVWPEPANATKMTTMAQEMFMDCTNLASITLPARVREIDNSAFLRCDNLKHVYYLGTKAQKENMLIRGSNGPLLDAAWHFVDPALTITAQPKSITVKSGARGTFSIKMKQTEVSYQWYTRPNGNEAWTLMDGETNATLTVQAGADNFGWQFRCTAAAEGLTVDSKIVTLKKK